jgi:hypothetical protein
MNEPHDIDEEQAAVIDKRLGQAFGFMRDVIDDPRTLEVIPSGSQLTFRDVEIADRRFRLVAYRLPGSEARWAARLTGSTKTGGETGHGFMIPASIESDVSAETALDAFEQLIQTIVALTHEPAHRTA